MTTAAKNQDQWPVGVCVFPEPEINRPRTVSYPNYIHEILGHAGVCYTSVNPKDLEADLDRVRILVTVGERELTDAVKQKLRAWTNAGGAWLSIGGICGMSDVLGAALPSAYQGFGAGARTLGEGYLVTDDKKHPVTAHLSRGLHFFNGLAMKASGATVIAKSLDAHGRATNEAVLMENVVGKGRCLALAVDLTGTVVHIQQGRSVTRDGVPPGDGSAPVSDGVLKSGDGGVLDWIFDREEVPGTPGFKAYLQPVADQWRELLIRSILHLAKEQNVALPVLWYWPRNLPAVAHMSHDTDGNEPAKAWKLMELLKASEINTTWCVILPGYEKSIMDAIAAAGHEFATHYDSMTEGLPWCEEQFERQWKELKAMFGPQHVPVSNKNHYLRWEGDMEFFDWCMKRGIQIDQSKGASKTGEAGFNFGTCHAYFPVRFDGQSVDVLEMATPTQDLNVFAPDTLLEPLLESVIKNNGIYHLLFHPAHVMKEDVARALLRAGKTANERGLEWWTARRINDWERARRQVKWSGYRQDGHVSLRCGTLLQEATMLWLAPKSTAGERIERWGFAFRSEVRSIDGGQEAVF